MLPAGVKNGWRDWAVIGFGNGVYNIRDGTVIVGLGNVARLRSRSYETFSKLFGRMQKNIQRGNNLTVTIE